MPLRPEAEVLHTHREGIQPRNHQLTVAECLKRWLVLYEGIQRHGDITTLGREVLDPRDRPPP